MRRKSIIQSVLLYGLAICWYIYDDGRTGGVLALHTSFRSAGVYTAAAAIIYADPVLSSRVYIINRDIKAESIKSDDDQVDDVMSVSHLVREYIYIYRSALSPVSAEGWWWWWWGARETPVERR